MKYIVCYSGGHSSAIVSIEAVRRYGKDNVILLNHNISSEVEHEDIKRFKQQVSDYLELPITYANMEEYEELTPIRLCQKLGAFQVNVGQALCTYNLKTKPFYDWLKLNYPADIEHINQDITIMYGFDENESHRITRRVGILASQGYMCDFPLLWKDRTIYNTEEIGIDRPRTYKIFHHANCIGCLKAGRQHWYVVYCLRNDIFQEAVQVENEIGHSIIKDIYLEELIPKFEEMKAKQICPNDIENQGTFWSRVNSILPDQTSFLPCDCAVL